MTTFNFNDQALEQFATKLADLYRQECVAAYAYGRNSEQCEYWGSQITGMCVAFEALTGTYPMVTRITGTSNVWVSILDYYDKVFEGLIPSHINR